MIPDFPDVTQLAVPGFVALMVLELVAARWLGREGYETRDTLASLCMGAGNLVEAVTVGTLATVVLLWIHARFALLDPGFGVLSITACFVLDDLRYYAFHRASHRMRWLWAAHVNHHSSQHYNLSTALRQTWSSTIALGLLFRIPLVLLGFHPALLAFVSGLNLVYQFWIHTELVDRLPRPVEWLFNTPSHHRVHHARNPRYLDANYAGTFIVWDRLFGTFVAERDDEVCRYGLVHNIATFNPLRIAAHEWVAMARDVLRPGRSLRQRVMAVVGPPGWGEGGDDRSTEAIQRAWRARVSSP